MDPLRVLLEILQDALREAVSEVEGRVYLRRAMPRQARDVSFLYVSLGDESIEPQDDAPFTVRRIRSFSITPVVRGDTEEAYDRALTLRERVIAIMREIQMIPAVDEHAPCLIDAITPTGESEIEIIANGDKYFTAVTLSYEAVYVTEEGSRSEAGPGVPEFNVLESLQRAVAKWTACSGEESLSVEDTVEFEEEE